MHHELEEIRAVFLEFLRETPVAEYHHLKTHLAKIILKRGGNVIQVRIDPRPPLASGGRFGDGRDFSLPPGIKASSYGVSADLGDWEKVR